MNEKKEKGNDRDQGSDELKSGQRMVTPTIERFSFAFTANAKWQTACRKSKKIILF